jgi:hypothetical protein
MEPLALLSEPQELMHTIGYVRYVMHKISDVTQELSWRPNSQCWLDPTFGHF